MTTLGVGIEICGIPPGLSYEGNEIDILEFCIIEEYGIAAEIAGIQI
jgi:hypothetical protein